MPGVQDKPPTNQEVQEVRKKALAKLGEEGIGNFLANDIEKLKSSDEYVAQFWKHVFDIPGDQGDAAVALVLKAFKWRKNLELIRLTRIASTGVSLIRVPCSRTEGIRMG
eukprot:TRINITY_DN25173_c0_g1_i1.p1 TRINITY_DN25173_c0_g1~~TRINITY_DN25173_c0_g1_i1.p1  ORF type:complete len:110 (+),score=21.05 TRINITY_DN25173_c0_g1_i1:80-409(+)